MGTSRPSARSCSALGPRTTSKVSVRAAGSTSEDRAGLAAGGPHGEVERPARARWRGSVARPSSAAAPKRSARASSTSALRARRPMGAAQALGAVRRPAPPRRPAPTGAGAAARRPPGAAPRRAGGRAAAAAARLRPGGRRRGRPHRGRRRRPPLDRQHRGRGVGRRGRRGGDGRLRQLGDAEDPGVGRIGDVDRAVLLHVAEARWPRPGTSPMRCSPALSAASQWSASTRSVSPWASRGGAAGM